MTSEFSLMTSPLNNGSPDEQKEGDRVALYSCGGPHFAPTGVQIGTKIYCPITEHYWVYADDIGQDGWKITEPNPTAGHTQFGEFVKMVKRGKA